jgi:hypothetical protein
MPLVDMKELETRAADLVVAELGAARWELRDTGKLGIQMRDFDIVFADGHEEPLEVTASADPMVLNTMHRMEGKNRIPASVRRSWLASAPFTSTDAAGTKTAFDRRRCVAVLVPFVERLDRDGHERFDTTRLAYAFGSPYQPEALELFELGIWGGSSYEPSDPDDKPAIWLQVGSGGSYGASSVTQALQRAAAEEDNQKKLAACPRASRRHLFVMLTSATEDLSWVALIGVLDGTHPLPPAPTLPEAITTVWAGMPDRGIYITPPGDWQTFGGSPDLN